MGGQWHGLLEAQVALAGASPRSSSTWAGVWPPPCGRPP